MDDIIFLWIGFICFIKFIKKQEQNTSLYSNRSSNVRSSDASALNTSNYSNLGTDASDVNSAQVVRSVRGSADLLGNDRDGRHRGSSQISNPQGSTSLRMQKQNHKNNSYQIVEA